MNESLRKQIVDKFRESIAKAEQYYKRDFSNLKKQIKYDLTGTTAGQYCFKNGVHEFRVNIELAEANLEDYLKNTIPHEVAHFVTDQVYGLNTTSHGLEWQNVMYYCFGLAPKRCHNYDTKNLKNKNKVQRHFYKCGCGYETNLSTTIHNRIQDRSRSYIFAKCHHKITPEQYQRSE